VGFAAGVNAWLLAWPGIATCEARDAVRLTTATRQLDDRLHQLRLLAPVATERKAAELVKVTRAATRQLGDGGRLADVLVNRADQEVARLDATFIEMLDLQKADLQRGP
jgi:hypothetical protein